MNPGFQNKYTIRGHVWADEVTKYLKEIKILGTKKFSVKIIIVCTIYARKK